MSREPGQAEEEPHEEVRSDRPVRVQADAPEEGGHPQRPEDQPDRAADQADGSACEDGG